MYWEKKCIERPFLLNIYKINNNYYLKYKDIIFDANEFILFSKWLAKLSLLIWLCYVILSYPIWKIFLKTIYRKIFKAVNDLDKKSYIDIDKMDLPKDDELKILFETINKQIENISAFNKYLSHELKTPLMSIMSQLDVLSIKYPNENIAQLKDKILFIKNIIDSLNYLLLIEAKKYKIQYNDFDICEFIKNYCQKIKLNVQIICNYNTIKTSKELFSLVLKNLLENMKKYSLKDPQITITDKFISFENKSTQIKNIEKLTEKFYKEWKNWLWIWLYLSKKICQMLGYEFNISYENNIFKIKIIF